MKQNNPLSTFSLFSLALILPFLLSCETKKKLMEETNAWKLKYYDAEFERRGICFSRYEYRPLKTELYIHVLRFFPKDTFDWALSAHKMIGINMYGDTIGAVALETESWTFDDGDTIIISPAYFDEIGKRNSHFSMWAISPNPRENDIFCSVKIVYYAEFKRPQSKQKK